LRSLVVFTILATKLFADNKVEGTFVILDPKTGEIQTTDAKLAETGFLPASTYKLPNTLIGLETGVVPDEHFALAWDGKDRGRPEWNRDQDLVSALRDSVVWFYQEIARRVGERRMQAWLDKLGYGNRKPTCAGKPCIDEFWLRGDLRITPLEQVTFLYRLRAGALPVSAAHRDLLLRILPDQGGFVGKTGTTRQDGHVIAWLVGYAGDRPYALLLRAPEGDLDRVTALRRGLAEALLREAHALP
jgi:beta-lactamase class D